MFLQAGLLWQKCWLIVEARVPGWKKQKLACINQWWDVMLSTLHQTPCVKDKSNQELRLYHVDTWQRHLGQGPKELQIIKAGLRLHQQSKSWHPTCGKQKHRQTQETSPAKPCKKQPENFLAARVRVQGSLHHVHYHQRHLQLASLRHKAPSWFFGLAAVDTRKHKNRTTQHTDKQKDVAMKFDETMVQLLPHHGCLPPQLAWWWNHGLDQKHERHCLC